MAGLLTFTLADLAPFTPEGKAWIAEAKEQGTPPDPAGCPIPAGADHWLFFVGRDDVHGILAYLFARVARSVYLNMFGYDDDELNELVMNLACNPQVTTMVTLDKSQSGGVHERVILASDAARDAAAFRASFAIGQSATHQISHTKGGVLDDRVHFEGSTNWSTSGEGTFVVSGAAGGPRYKAQNNTLAVFSDKETRDAFRSELVHEHQVVLGAGGKIAAK